MDEKKDKGKVVAFGKTKRITPEDQLPFRLGHPCNDGDVFDSFKWFIHVRNEEITFLCAGCGHPFSLEEIQSADVAD